MAGHETLLQAVSQNIGWIIFLVLVFGGAVIEVLGKVFSIPFLALSGRGKSKRKHQLALKKLELQIAEARTRSVPQDEDAPPGPCQHYRVTPVVSDDEVMAWLCKNPECSAQLPADFAVRAEDLPKGKKRRTE